MSREVSRPPRIIAGRDEITRHFEDRYQNTGRNIRGGSQMPTFMVWARIVAKRENYYVTFEDANRSRREFQVNSRDYAQLEVGDTGGLSYDEVGS